MAELCPIGTPYPGVQQHEPIKASLGGVGGSQEGYKCSGQTPASPSVCLLQGGSRGVTAPFLP